MMNVAYTFLDLAEEVLEHEKRPLSAVEIWEAAVSLGLDRKKGSTGKTPEKSVGAQLYTEIRDNPASPIVQTSKRPALFCLKKYADAPQPAAKAAQAPAKRETWKERDLHPLLATYARSADHFRCATMTISEKRSRKGSYTNADKWTHPDVVGVRFPFDDYDPSTIRLMSALRENPYTIFSFELKRELEPSQLREKYFQAVSNSSWANEGYLVAARVSRDPDFLDDLQRLVNAFGIGVIELNVPNIEQSEVLYPARHNQTLDWATVDRIASKNPDFRDFITNVVSAAKAEREVVGKHAYDETIKPERYERYLEDHGFATTEGERAL